MPHWNHSISLVSKTSNPISRFRSRTSARTQGFRSNAAVESLTKAREERTQNIVLYNYPSFSGAFAALFAHLFHRHLNLPCLILPFSSVEPFRVEDLCIDGLEKCYFLDFLGPKGFAAELSRRTSCHVIGFDHRKTTLTDIHLYEDCNSNLSLQVNLEKNSSSAVYDYFCTKLSEMKCNNGPACLLNTEDQERVETVLKYIEDGDLRKWTLPDIKEFNIGLSNWRSKLNCITNPHLFEQLMKISVTDLVAHGSAYMATQHSLATKFLEKVFKVRLGRGLYGECLGVRIDGNSNLSDIIGKELSMKSEAAGLRPIGAVVYMQRKNLKMCLRSTDRSTDTSAIAKVCGGGGTPSSSSFIIRMDEYNQWVSDMGKREPSMDLEGDELLGESSSSRVHINEVTPFRTRYPGLVRLKAYIFDGLGDYYNKEWDLLEGRGKEFCWYHVEIPKGNQKLSQSAQYLIDVLCPPLKLQDILALISNGPYCGHVDGALVFRVNSPGPPSSKFTFRLAARVTENSVITVSLGRVPRLGFSPMGQSLLSEIPSVESPSAKQSGARENDRIVIKEHVLDFLLTMNHSEEADNPVPKSISNLVVHIVDTHVDHLEDVVTKLEIELDSVEVDLDKGGFSLKKQLLDDRRFPKMHLDLQRLLQVITHGEQVFPRVKEKCSTKEWFASEDINSLEELIRRLRRLKDNVGFISNRVTAVQAGLDSWQAEQINRKLYYLSFLSIIFLPLSIITGVFGMNVGGVPWTGQRDPALADGFRNVMLVCVATLGLVLLCFLFPFLYSRITVWRRQRSLRRSWSLNRRSFLKRTLPEERGGYLRL